MQTAFFADRGGTFKGFGVLRYRYVDDNFYVPHFPKTSREALDAERWLRGMLRCGAVDADTALLTRWSDDLNRVEVVVGELSIRVLGMGR